MTDTRDLTIADPSAVPLPPASLANGEDGAAYERLAARIRAAVAPANIIEEIWARDVADLTWDVVRLRRLKAGLYTIGAGDGMTQILCGLEQHAITGKLRAKEWAARKPAALAEVNTQLSAAGLDMGDVATSTFAVRIDQFDRIERMLAAAEVRRAAALHAIDNRRAAERARAAVPPIEEGEFTLVPETEAERA
jgi:hypothetical protein